LRQSWSRLHVGETNLSSTDHRWTFSAAVYFGDLSHDGVRVELYADPLADRASEIHEMIQSSPIGGSSHGYIYSATIDQSRPADDYTIRLVPRYPGVGVPAELPLILWQN